MVKSKFLQTHSRAGVGCTKAGYRYPPGREFFQLPLKGIKSSDTKNIDLARDRK